MSGALSATIDTWCDFYCFLSWERLLSSWLPQKGWQEGGLCFFHYPLADKDRCVKWVAAVNRKNWVPKQHTRTCNEHFTAGMYSGCCLLEEATWTEDGRGGLSGLV